MTEQASHAEPTTGPVQSANATDGGKQMALVVYILYFIGFVFPLTALAGVIIAHFKAGDADEIYRSHYRYQMRTFWFGLLISFIGGLLAMILVGYLVLIAWAIWTLVRCIKGVIRLSDNKPIEAPTTLLW